MIKYIGGRGSGKTYRLMQLADKFNIPIIIANRNEVPFRNKYAKSLGFGEHYISLEDFLLENVDFEDIIKIKKGEKDRLPILIDDAEEVLADYMPFFEIKAVSIGANENKYLLTI